MPASIISAARSLCSALAAFEAGTYSGADCAQLVEELAATEKASAGVRLLAAKRAVECKAYEQKGFADGADWLATQAGITPGEAKRNLKTAGELDEHPETKDALLTGKLSVDQAGEILETNKEVPGSEKELVDLAGKKDLSRVREAARDIRQEAADAKDLHRRQRNAREFRMWTNQLGNICGRFELAPESGVAFKNRLERETYRINKAAKQNAKQDANFELESWDAYAADAFVNLLNTGGGSSARPGRTDMVIVCDLRAWLRGYALPGEPCHIIDGGRIPVELAKELAKAAVFKAVTHDGVKVDQIKHFGRHIPAELRTALELGDPPDFSGAVCGDCGRRHSLEIDHVDPIANDGPTSLENLKHRCYPDHKRKTERDRKAGLLKPKQKPVPAGSSESTADPANPPVDPTDPPADDLRLPFPRPG